jgi:AAA family ATP:ADP antiporter
MEQGQLFFAWFINFIWMLRWPLGLFFIGCVIRYVGQLRANERRHATFMFCYLFLITTVYWLIKPIKKALLVGYYQSAGWTIGVWHLNAAQVELVAKAINLFLALGAAVCFARLAAHVKRERLALSVILFFGIGFSVFALMPSVTGPLRAWLFYFYGDFFITLMIAAFFAFLNDSGNSRMARRLYGLIGLGGVLGGFFGSVVVAAYAQQINPINSAWICVGLLCLMAMMAWLSAKEIKPAPIRGGHPTETPLQQGSTWRQDIRDFLNSPYLIGIALMVGLYEMVSSIMEYQFTATVLHFVANSEIKSHFANVFSFTTFISILAQLFLTRSVMTHMGMGRALLILPLTMLVGEAGFVVLPGLLAGSLLNTFGSSLAYSVNQSVKEALYIPMPREEKYRAKALIDIFVLRCSKAIALIAVVLLTMVFTRFENLRWLSLIVFVLLAVWLFTIYRMGWVYKKMVVQHSPTPLPGGDDGRTTQSEALL